MRDQSAPKDFVFDNAGKAKRFSPLWRPMFPPSKKNVESMDAQAERDRMQQDFLRNKHLKNAGPAHHIAPQKDVFAGPWDGTTGMDGKPRNYVDRFVKYRGTENILEHDASKYSKRPSTAGASDDGKIARPHAASLVREAQGKYNPVTGEWTQPQDPSVATAYAKQFNREQIVGRGHGAGLRESSYDPIRGVYRDRPPTAPPPAERTLVKKQASGESWGQYNPINHTWREAPRDARFVDRNAHTERVLAFTGRSMAHPTTMQRHGAYNPIIGEWKVLPAEPREAAMYCAHATTMFTQQRFTDKQ